MAVFTCEKCGKQRGHPLQTQEMPGLQRNRRHVQSGGPGDPAQKGEEVNQQGSGVRGQGLGVRG